MQQPHPIAVDRVTGCPSVVTLGIAIEMENAKSYSKFACTGASESAHVVRGAGCLFDVAFVSIFVSTGPKYFHNLYL